MLHCVILLDRQINLDAPIEAPLPIMAKKHPQPKFRYKKPTAKPPLQQTTDKPYLPHSQFTHPNPPQATAQQRPLSGGPRFLEFPGEIRNLIYGYVFPRELYEIGCLGKKAKSLTYRFGTQPLKGPRLDPSVDRRRRLLDYPRRIRSNECVPLYELSPGPAAILLTCKQIHEEASLLLYTNSTFAFLSLQALSTFLNTIRTSCKQSIRSLHLKHHTAGVLGLTEANKGTEQYNQKWLDLCWKVRDELCNLKELGIVLTINDRPLSFGEEAAWKAPLLAFSGIGLERCSIILNGPTFNTVLEAEAHELRQLLLGENFVPGANAHSFWFIKERKEKQQQIHFFGPHRVLQVSAENRLF